MNFAIWDQDDTKDRVTPPYGLKAVGDQCWGDVPQPCTVCSHQEIREWRAPRQLTIVDGNFWPDVLDSDMPDGSRAVSKRFRDEWSKSGLTGLRFSEEPLIVLRNRKMKDLEVPDYYSAQPVRSRTQIDAKQSGAILSEDDICSECGNQGVLLHCDRMVLNEASWDGMAVFRPAFSRCGIVVVSADFAEWANANAISNVELIMASDFRHHRPEFEWRLMGYTGPMPSK